MSGLSYSTGSFGRVLGSVSRSLKEGISKTLHGRRHGQEWKNGMRRKMGKDEGRGSHHGLQIMMSHVLVKDSIKGTKVL